PRAHHRLEARPRERRPRGGGLRGRPHLPLLDGLLRGPQLPAGPDRLPPAAQRPEADAARQRDRSLVRVHGSGPDLEGRGRHQLPRRPPQQEHPPDRVAALHGQGPARHPGDRPPDGGPDALRPLHQAREGDAGDRAEPHGGAADGHRRRPRDRRHVRDRRAARGRRQRHLRAHDQHGVDPDGLPERALRVHRGRARRHRQSPRRDAGRHDHRPRSLPGEPVRRGTVDQRARVRDPHHPPRVPSLGPARRPDEGEGMSRSKERWLALGTLVVLVLFPLVASPQLGGEVKNILIFCILAMGLNVVVGYAGLLQLGIAAFFGIGAYITGILTVSQFPFQWNFWPAMMAATVGSAVAAILLAAPALRLRGDYLAIVTLGFGEVIKFTIKNLENITNGSKALNPIPAPNAWLDWNENYRG